MLRKVNFEFLRHPRNAFLAFLSCGLLDDLSTMLLVRQFGIGVEVNPLTRAGFASLGFFYFIPHFLAVACIAFVLSRPSWNEPARFKVKSALLVVYGYVLAVNWYQVMAVHTRPVLSSAIQFFFPS